VFLETGEDVIRVEQGDLGRVRQTQGAALIGGEESSERLDWRYSLLG
jgi:hypothetical protein